MKASEAPLLQFLRKSPQFIIPIYQRTYSWTEKECAQLWNDILRAGMNEDVSGHFLGSVVYIEQGLGQVIAQSPLLVIDGQQRLTTICLLLEALAEAVGEDEPVEGFSAKKIRSYHLRNDLETGDKRYKLILTETDKETLISILNNSPRPVESSHRISENFEYFRKQIQSLGKEIHALCLGLSKMVIVDVALNRGQDNPQLIFESMNSTGRKLSQADLVRNYILMGLEPEIQTRLYRDYWRPMELRFGQDSYTENFDSFMRHFLTYRTGAIPKISDVYETFKAYSGQKSVKDSGIESLVHELHRASLHYCRMALGQETDNELRQAFDDLADFRVGVAYPLLLAIYEDYSSTRLQKDDFLRCIRVIESYVFRRAVCSIPTNSMNKTFAQLYSEMDQSSLYTSLCAILMQLPSYRRFPRDDEFKAELMARDLYNFPRRSYWLGRLENHERKERVSISEYTIEHIMPQNEKLSDAWRAELGPEWKRVHESKLHTLGNLTLTGYNSEYSDRPFSQKRDMQGGFRMSPLRLNHSLGSVDTWNEAAIDARAASLAALAIEVWEYPQVSTEALENYRPQKTRRTGQYNLGHHSRIAEGGPMHGLFIRLRNQILGLDPCINEEFLKLYVAYKSETNFVDIIPKTSKLDLVLNMPFHHLKDPRGLARDVTEVGFWGNGDVVVSVDENSDLTYVLSLIRQALERQLDAPAE